MTSHFFPPTPPPPPSSITSPTWASCPHVHLDGGQGMTPDGLRLVEPLMRRQGGVRGMGGCVSTRSVLFQTSGKHGARCATSFSHFSPTRRVPFCRLLSFGIKKTTKPSSAKGSSPDSSWLSDETRCAPLPKAVHLTAPSVPH